MPSPIKDTPDKRLEQFTVVGATVLAAVLSFLLIGHKSLWLDEGSSLYFAQDWSHMWRELLGSESNMWLYYILLHFWMRLGDSEAVLRSLSAVFAIATVPVGYGLARRLFGTRAAAIAAFLLAVNPFLIRYAQEARGYSMLAFFVTLSSYCFIVALDTNASWRWWIAHGLCTGAAIATHYFGVQVALTQLLVLVAVHHRRLPWKGILTSAAFTVPLLLALVLLHRHEPARIAWIATPGLSDVLRLARLAAGSRPLLLVYGVLCIWALILHRPSRAAEPLSPGLYPYLYAAAWLVLPTVMTFAFSRLVKPLFVDRYLIVSVPALVLLGAAGLAQLPRRWMRLPVLVLMLYLSSRTLHWWYLQAEREDWREVATFMQSESEAGDGAVCYHFGTERPLGYYLSRQQSTGYTPPVLGLACEPAPPTWSANELNTELLAQLPATYRRVWLVLHHDLLIKDPPHRTIILEMLDSNYERVAEYRYPEIHVLLFERPDPPSLPNAEEQLKQPTDTKEQL